MIGFGSIWGLFALGGTFFSSFTFGRNDTLPEIIASLLYGLTILPACLLAVWKRKIAALWLLFLAPVTALGWSYQVMERSQVRGVWQRSEALGIMLVTASIPGVLGAVLLRLQRR